jgi:hypothetical protein
MHDSTQEAEVTSASNAALELLNSNLQATMESPVKKKQLSERKYHKKKNQKITNKQKQRYKFQEEKVKKLHPLQCVH